MNYFGSTCSFGSVGVTCAPADAAAVSVVALAPARPWSGFFAPTSQKTPIAAARTTAALAKTNV
jgi:hypothetical protein